MKKITKTILCMLGACTALSFQTCSAYEWVGKQVDNNDGTVTIQSPTVVDGQDEFSIDPTSDLGALCAGAYQQSDFVSSHLSPLRGQPQPLVKVSASMDKNNHYYFSLNKSTGRVWINSLTCKKK